MIRIGRQTAGAMLAATVVFTVACQGTDPSGPTLPSTNTPPAIDVAGQWVGTGPDGLIVTAGVEQCEKESDLFLELTMHPGWAVTGTARRERRLNTPGLTCAPGPSIKTGPIVGSISQRDGTVSIKIYDGTNEVYELIGTATATRMSGTFAFEGFSKSGTWSLRRP